MTAILGVAGMPQLWRRNVPKPEPRQSRNLAPVQPSKYDALNESGTFNANMADALETCNGQTLARALARVVGAGDALLLSLTSDRGALCITILEEERRHKFYCSTPRDLEETLARLLV